MWIRTKDRLPPLDERYDFTSVEVIAYPKGWNKPTVMQYERVRLKSGRKERWLWHDRIFHDEVTHWMPLPHKPEEDDIL